MINYKYIFNKKNFEFELDFDRTLNFGLFLNVGLKFIRTLDCSHFQKTHSNSIILYYIRNYWIHQKFTIV